MQEPGFERPMGESITEIGDLQQQPASSTINFASASCEKRICVRSPHMLLRCPAAIRSCAASLLGESVHMHQDPVVGKELGLSLKRAAFGQAAPFCMLDITCRHDASVVTASP